MHINYLILTFFLLAGCNSDGERPNSELASQAQRATIKTIHGNIVFEFFPEKAPRTVTRIKQLIDSGFYDGLTFHRVEPGALIQGGDPNGNGTGGSGKKLKAEFNSISHQPGIVSMARAADPDSADSQFFICIKALPMLDGKYTVFGKVVDGMEVVSKISPGDKMISVVTTNQ